MGGKGVDAPDSRLRSLEPLASVRFIDLWALTSLNIPYGFICGSMGVFLIPLEMQRLFPNKTSVALGFTLGIVGLSQLVCPVAGRLSDRFPGITVYERRCPYIVGGTLCGIVGVVGLWICSLARLSFSFYGFLLLGMLGLNIVYAVQSSLIPDCVAPCNMGKSSALIAINTVVGSGSGFVAVALLPPRAFQALYPTYAAFLSLCTVITLRTFKSVLSQAPAYAESSLAVATDVANHVCPEDPEILPLMAATHNEENRTDPMCWKSNKDPLLEKVFSDTAADKDLRALEHHLCAFQQPSQPKKQTKDKAFLPCPDASFELRNVLKGYVLELCANRDFVWVFLGRTWYYIAVSSQAYLYYYIRDVIGISDPEEQQRHIGILAFGVQGTAALVAYPVGILIDRGYVTKHPLIYLACFLMAVAYTLFLTAPIVSPNLVLVMVGLSAITYGFGNGSFLDADYALAVDTASPHKRVAELLGLWGISAFIGMAVGPLVWGTVLSFFIEPSSPVQASGAAALTSVTHYAYAGYIVVLLGGIVATALAGVAISFVQCGRVHNDAVEPYAIEKYCGCGTSTTPNAFNTNA